jgi:collagenase-like PrtC family protease
MEIAVTATAALTLGPVLFNWAPETWRDFYFRIADEAPVADVYLGEVVCSKRAPLFEPYVADVAGRLAAAGKTVVFSTLAEVMSKPDRRLVEVVCAADGLVEVNDASALARVRGRPHRLGPLLNVYNEHTAAVLARRGARSVCLPPELPATAIAAFCAGTAGLGLAVEVQVFGRLPLALSARCYHARAHGRTKDSCQFVCEQDADGLPLATIDGAPFLTINGVQTLSHDYLSLIGELPALRAMGVARLRLSPHSCDMVAVARTFRDALDDRIGPDEAQARLGALGLDAPFSNGFFHGRPGREHAAASGCGGNGKPAR